MRRYGRIPASIVESGVVAGMTGAEARLYMVLAAHVNDAGICWPGLPRVCELTGLGPRSVRRAARALERKGVLTTKSRPGPGSLTTYTLHEVPDTAVRNSDRDADTTDRNSHEVPDTPRPRCGQNGAGVPDTAVRPYREQRKEQEKQGTENPPNPPRAGGNGAGDKPASKNGVGALTEALLEKFYGGGASGADRRQCERAADILHERQATPDDVAARLRRWRFLYPCESPSLRQLVRRWAKLKPPAPMFLDDVA